MAGFYYAPPDLVFEKAVVVFEVVVESSYKVQKYLVEKVIWLI